MLFAEQVLRKAGQGVDASRRFLVVLPSHKILKSPPCPGAGSYMCEFLGEFVMAKGAHKQGYSVCLQSAPRVRLDAGAGM